MANGYRPEQFAAEEFERPSFTVDVPLVAFNNIKQLASSEAWVAYSEDEVTLLKSVVSVLKAKLACISAELSKI